MSGHSKWSQIKHQKTSQDQKRGQVFTKLANAISIAVKGSNGNGDPETNFHLRLLIEKAKNENMPKENIMRAIEHGKGGGNAKELEEVIYEGYGPSGVAILIEATTNNRAKTTSEIKNIFEKGNGKLGSPGSVNFLFKKVGLISVKKGEKKSEEIMMIAIDSGAIDIEEAGDEILIYTEKEKLPLVKKLIESAGLNIINCEQTMRPVTTVPIPSKDDGQKIIYLIEKFENQEDVQRVYANPDIRKSIYD